MGQAKVRKAEITALKTATQSQEKPKSQVNESALIEVLVRMSDIMLKHNPEQDYDQTDFTLETANQIAQHYSLGSGHLQQILRFRERFEQGIESKYGMKFASGVGAFCQDTGAALKDAGVPQKVRVSSGLLDTLIGVLSMKSGTVSFNFG